MGCGFSAAQRICPAGGNAPPVGRRLPCHADFPGLQRTRDRFVSLGGFRPLRQSSFSSQQNQGCQHRRHFRGCRARIRGASRTRGNRAGSQVQASKGPQVPLHFRDRSPFSIKPLTIAMPPRLGRLCRMKFADRSVHVVNPIGPPSRSTPATCSASIFNPSQPRSMPYGTAHRNTQA